MKICGILCPDLKKSRLEEMKSTLTQEWQLNGL